MKVFLHWLSFALVIIPIKIYQLCISPFIGNRCRFHPSCSSYAIEAITEHGTVKGGFLTIKRISRCHPWSAGGYDPVPDTVNPPGKHDR